MCVFNLREFSKWHQYSMVSIVQKKILYISNEKYISKENLPSTLGVYSGKSTINSNYNAQIYLKG